MADRTTSNKGWKEHLPLHGAILNSKWDKVREIFRNNKQAFTVQINDDDGSPLHVAVSTCKNIHIVENLLNEIDPQLLPDIVTKESRMTTLHRAALVGNKDAAKMLVEKNSSLLFIPDKDKLLPIHRAAFGSHGNTVEYLLEETKKYIEHSKIEGHDSPFEGESAALLISSIIGAGNFDIAYQLINEFPNMAREMKGNKIPLKAIAGKSDTYFSGRQYNFYQKYVYDNVQPIHNDNHLENPHEKQSDIENQLPDDAKSTAKDRRSCFHSVMLPDYIKYLWKMAPLHVPYLRKLQEEKESHNKALKVLRYICKEVRKIDDDNVIREHYTEALCTALYQDNIEAIEEIISSYPQVIWTTQHEYNLTQLAVVTRCSNVYNYLVHRDVDAPDKHVDKLRYDKDGNNLLHLAGKLAPIDKLNMISGAALQMQRELQWFEEVKKFVAPRNSKKKNNKQETPMMVFRREHRELRKEGEEWMKKTADSYTITAALIITIVFAAAITVPGGNDNSGKAIYARNNSFIIFAISLLTSTTSLLLFLSILTTRYREEDFLESLPKRLIFGLVMLFLSVTSMMVAFSATLYLMFGQGRAWILIPIVILTCFPIASFVTLQLPLLVDLISSTYGQGIFRKHKDMGTK